MTQKNIIYISDTHFPYHHRDTFEFLTAVRDTFNINIAKHVGDIVDNHSGSYHEIVYGALSAKEEYIKAVECCQRLEKIFPKLTISEGNHDRITKRKAQTAGIPEDFLKSYNSMYGVGKGWKFVPSEVHTTTTKEKALLTHTISSSTKANAQKYSHSSIQGHHHSEAGVMYYADTENLRWAMSVGCLIDHKAPAFAYAKASIVRKPILGCGVVIDGTPLFVPMKLTKTGRWNKRIPYCAT